MQAVARIVTAVCGVAALLLLLVAVPFAVEPPADNIVVEPPATDPYVLLDTAKLKLGEGRLPQAMELLAEIPVNDTDGYIAEEILLQQMLINSALFSATHYLLAELERNATGDSAYAGWLTAERDGYADRFAILSSEYLDRTAAGPRLDFVRFRLPVVTAGHLADLELYTDPEILGPAVNNWDDGRQGLGKGLIAGQARVALVLSAARHYDHSVASRTLEGASNRLRGGVPLDYATVLDWIAETAGQADGIEQLAELARRADQRLLASSSALQDGDLRIRAEARLNGTGTENSVEQDASE